MSTLIWLDDSELWFPPIDEAQLDPDGLLAVGGDLSMDRLLLAYASGIFPWFEDDQPFLWWSPSTRTVIQPCSFEASKSLKKKLRKNSFEVKVNHDFASVIRACSAPRQGSEGTWITEDIHEAYIALHEQGYAHSFECYQNNELVGGLYGVSIGKLFFGESMFHTVSDASKVAFAYLCKIMTLHDCPLIDCQIENPHLSSLGCGTISREYFKSYLETDKRASPPIDWTKINGRQPDWQTLEAN